MQRFNRFNVSSSGGISRNDNSGLFAQMRHDRRQEISKKYLAIAEQRRNQEVRAAYKRAWREVRLGNPFIAEKRSIRHAAKSNWLHRRNHHDKYENRVWLKLRIRED